MSTNHVIIIFCAVERCLMGKSYVDYAVRDYVYSNLHVMQAHERKNLAAIIAASLDQVPKDKLPFWNEFITTLAT